MKNIKTKKKALKTPKKNKTQEPKSPAAVSKFYSLFLILMLGILCYSNTLHNPFIFDDIPNIVEYETIHLDSLSPAKLAQLKFGGRPVARFSFAANYYLGKLDPFGYHLFNLLIHLLTAVLVYLFLHLTLNLPALQERYGKQAREIALITALLFVVHPIQTQAVTYIVQRMASLAALFFLLALYCYAKARLAGGKLRTVYFAGTALATLLALGSKENAVTLPFFILLYEYYFRQGLKLDPAKKKKIYLAIGLGLLVSLLAGSYYLGFDFASWLGKEYQRFPFTPGQRMLTQLRVVIFYLSLLIAPLPSRLNLDHQFPLSYSLLNPPTTLLCLILVLALIGISIYLAKKRPLISFFIIWFWGNLLLESSFLPLDMVFEHRLYLPSVGFFVLVSIFLVKAIEGLKTQVQLKQQIKLGLLLALIIPLSVMTYQRNKVWQDEVALWEDAVSKSPRKARIHNNLGNAYRKQGRLAEAITYYKRTLEITPGFKEAHHNLGNAYLGQEQLAEAIAQYQRTLEIDPGYKGTHNNLGIVYLRQGKLEQAIAEFLEEMKHNPGNAQVSYNLANAYQKQGQLAEAIVQYQQALKINPGFKQARNKLEIIYPQQGKLN